MPAATSCPELSSTASLFHLGSDSCLYRYLPKKPCISGSSPLHGYNGGWFVVLHRKSLLSAFATRHSKQAGRALIIMFFRVHVSPSSFQTLRNQICTFSSSLLHGYNLGCIVVFQAKPLLSLFSTGYYEQVDRAFAMNFIFSIFLRILF